LHLPQGQIACIAGPGIGDASKFPLRFNASCPDLTEISIAVLAMAFGTQALFNQSFTVPSSAI